jgi:hypothetical protein
MAQITQLTQRKNWFENHPKFIVIQANGYDKHNPFTSRSAMLVYLELVKASIGFTLISTVVTA